MKAGDEETCNSVLRRSRTLKPVCFCKDIVHEILMKIAKDLLNRINLILAKMEIDLLINFLATTNVGKGSMCWIYDNKDSRHLTPN